MAAVTYGNFRKCCLFWLFFLALFIFSMSCSSKTSPLSDKSSRIRIGFIITSGDERIVGSNQNVLEMVKSGIEMNGGLEVGGGKHPVSFIIKMIEGETPNQTVRVVEELINQENVAAIVGPQYSVDAISAGEVAERSKIPLITPSSNHPRTTEGRRYVFRASFLNDFQAKAMARFCTHDLNASKVAVLFNVANPYSRDLAEMFRDTVVSEGGAMPSLEVYVTGQTDFKTELEKIRDNNPDVLYLPNFNEETEAIAIQARDMKIDAVLLGIVTWNSEKFTTMPQFEGSYMVAYLSPDIMTGSSRAFAEDFMSRYGYWPQDGTILTYDTFGILFAAIRYADSFEPEAIRDALYDLGPYEGVSGKIDFIDSGDPERNAVIIRFENGQIKFKKRIHS